MGINVKTHNRTIIAKPRVNSARAWNGTGAPKLKTRARKSRSKKMVTEVYGNELYEFFRLGKYIVAAPQVCYGEPTFKYTRIQAFYALDLIAAGWTAERIANEWWDGAVSVAAIQEALGLATKALDESAAALVDAQ